MRLWLTALLAGLLLAGLGLKLWPRQAPRYLEGVDVSHHQGAIDWAALAGDGVRFAYIKASEGGDHVDPRFAENWRAAGAAGLYRGAYHYFTRCRSGAAQAAHFLATVPPSREALPPALDLEHKGPCQAGPTLPDVAAEAQVFLDLVEAGYGKRPILYTTRAYHDAHLAGLAGERFWLRALSGRPDFREDAWVVWQHSSRGRRRGVAGPVDLNYFRGDAAALAAFAGAPNALEAQR